MLAAITSEMADIVRPRAWNASRRQFENRSLSVRGTKGSNQSLPSAESATNLVAARGVACGWDSEFESALLQRRVQCEPGFLIRANILFLDSPQINARSAGHLRCCFSQDGDLMKKQEQDYLIARVGLQGILWGVDPNAA